MLKNVEGVVLNSILPHGTWFGRQFRLTTFHDPALLLRDPDGESSSVEDQIILLIGTQKEDFDRAGASPHTTNFP